MIDAKNKMDTDIITLAKLTKERQQIEEEAGVRRREDIELTRKISEIHRRLDDVKMKISRQESLVQISCRHYAEAIAKNMDGSTDGNGRG